jgi:hypothetical protein
MRTIAAALFLAGLVAGGFLWHRADAEATARAAWLADSVSSEDDTVGVSLAAVGFLSRDVLVSAYTLGERDQITADFWADEISNSEAQEFYERGFRKVIISGSISRMIGRPVKQARMQEKESGELSAWSIR